MAVSPLVSGSPHVASLRRCRHAATPAATGRLARQAQLAGPSRGGPAGLTRLARQQRNAGGQLRAAASDAQRPDPSAASSHGDSGSPPETDAATPTAAPPPPQQRQQRQQGRRSRADRYKSAFAVRTDSERSVAAITSILGGMPQSGAKKAAAPQAVQPAAGPAEIPASATDQAAAEQQAAAPAAGSAAAMQHVDGLAVVQHPGSQQGTEAAAAQQHNAAAAEAGTAASVAAGGAQQAAPEAAAAHKDKLQQRVPEDTQAQRPPAQLRHKEGVQRERATAAAKRVVRTAQKAEVKFRKSVSTSGTKTLPLAAAKASQENALPPQQWQAEQPEAAAAGQQHLQAADSQEARQPTTAEAAAGAQTAAAAQEVAPTSKTADPALGGSKKVQGPTPPEPGQNGSKEVSQSSTISSGGGGSSAGSGSSSGSHSVDGSSGPSASKDGGWGAHGRQLLHARAKWQPPAEAQVPQQGRGAAASSSKYAPTIEQRQRSIHDKLMKKWHTLKDQELAPELRTAAMKKALYEALRLQYRLNRSADEAAAAAGFEPPSALSWTERFRLRKAAINEHYRERMEAVTATAYSPRSAEGRGIPAVCTALAGVRLLHLEIEQEARATGMAVPPGLTLDAQWAVEDQLSGEVSELIKTATVPSAEPQTLGEELSGIVASMFGRASRKRKQNAAPAPPAAPGVRFVHETAGSPLHQQFAQLLKEAAMLSETWCRQYEEFFARKELTRRGQEQEASASTGVGSSAAPSTNTSSGSGNRGIASNGSGTSSGASTSGGISAAGSQAPAPPRNPATAPSTGHVLQQMWGGFFGGRREAAEPSSPSSAPGGPDIVQATAGGGVVYQPKSLAAPPQQQPNSAAPRAMLQWKAKTLAEQPKFFSPTRQREQELFELGYRRLAGIDDSGGGSAAGPIVAAACAMPLDVNIRGVRDSKALIAVERQQVFAELIRHPAVAYSTYVVDAFVVDEVGVEAANLVAMAGAWRNLAAAAPDYVLLDGVELPKGLEAMEAGLAVPKGDRSDYIIAAASIIATVTREHIMEQLARLWPQYGFAGNHGHLDAVHKAALREHGRSPVHRLGERVNFLSSGLRLR